MQRDPVVGVIRVPGFSLPVLPGLPAAARELVQAVRDEGIARIDADRYELPQARETLGRAMFASAPKRAATAQTERAAPARAVNKVPTRQEEMLTNIAVIHEFFRVRYAPADYKATSIGRSIDQLRDNVIAAVKANPQMTLPEYHGLLSREFFQKLEDFHVSVRFSSTRADALPFMLVPTADGRFVVGHVSIDEDGPREAARPEHAIGGGRGFAGFGFHKLLGDAAAEADLKEGDEVLTWNGRPIKEVVEELRTQLGMGTSETATLLVSRILTSRSGGAAHPIPSEHEVTLGVESARGQAKTVKLPWVSVPELLNVDEGDKWASAVQRNDALLDQVHAEANMFVPDRLNGVQQANAFGIGDKETFVPELGPVLMRTPPDFPFEAYICELPNGKRAGVVRIESYAVEQAEEHAAAFAGLMKIMQEKTDCVVLNQVNNPGGSVLYLYALASALAPRGLEVPQHHMAVTKQDATSAFKNLTRLQQVTSEEQVGKAFPPTLDGYPTDLKLVEGLKNHYKQLINDQLSGKTVTGGLYVNGIKTIEPSPLAVYDGPLVVLTNGLCFSGADFMPCMLQDNGRALVFGSNTAGAGGYVKGEQVENNLGVEGFQLTGSIADRSTRKPGEKPDDRNVIERPIEGKGATPDVKYDITVDDVRDGYQGYRAALADACMGQIEKHERESGRARA